MYNFHSRFSKSNSKGKISPEDRKLPSPPSNDDNHEVEEGGTPGNVSIIAEPSPCHGFWDVLSFGICVSASNCFIDWSSGFAHGYWDFFFTTLVASTTFICLHLCIAEMVSVLPFAGGMYALARVTCSPYIGFLVGSFEVAGNIVYALVAMIPIGSCVTYMTGFDSKYEPIYWFIAYSLVILIEFTGRRFFFMFLRCMALITIILLMFYLIVSSQDLHPSQYIPSQPTAFKSHLFSGGITNMLSILPISGWYYFGIEIIPLVSDEIKDVSNLNNNTPLTLLT